MDIGIYVFDITGIVIFTIGIIWYYYDYHYYWYYCCFLFFNYLWFLLVSLSWLESIMFCMATLFHHKPYTSTVSSPIQLQQPKSYPMHMDIYVFTMDHSHQTQTPNLVRQSCFATLALSAGIWKLRPLEHRLPPSV